MMPEEKVLGGATIAAYWSEIRAQSSTDGLTEDFRTVSH
jgi:hypothetical protein